MNNKLIIVVLFSIVTIVLFESEIKGQISIVDSVTIGDFWNKKNAITVTNETESKVYPISITNELPMLKFLIGAQTNSGVITFTIYDPTGKERDNVSLKWTDKGKYHLVDGDSKRDKTPYLGGQCEWSSGDPTTVRGAFSATYENPIQGEWKIKVSPDMADGFYNVMLQTVKPSPKHK